VALFLFSSWIFILSPAENRLPMHLDPFPGYGNGEERVFGVWVLTVVERNFGETDSGQLKHSSP